MDIQIAIRNLAAYAYRTGLVPEEDLIFLLNSLSSLFGLFEVSFQPEDVIRKASTISKTDIETGQELESLLFFMEDRLKKESPLPSYTKERDFASRIMAYLTPPPSVLLRIFREKCAISAENASDWFYDFSKNCNYIRRYQIAKNIHWASFTSYGDLALTLDASSDPLFFRPEEYSAYTEHAYPACILCRENIGYSGHPSYPSGRTRRSIRLVLLGKAYDFQYLPGAAAPELFLLSSEKHEKEKADKEAILRLLEFTRQFPHYFVGMDTDLPFAKKSPSEHAYFLGGRFATPLSKAESDRIFSVKGYPDIRCSLMKWPASVIRLQGKDPQKLADLAEQIQKNWQNYSDDSISLFSESAGKRHHGISIIARRRESLFELDLILRSNLCDREHPEGIFYPRRQYQHFIYHGIGILELSGLMIFPWQLKLDLEQIEQALLEKRSLASTTELRRHVDWAKDIRRDHKALTKDNITSVLKKEIGMAFLHMLEDSAVFKRTPSGQDAFDRFILSMEAVFTTKERF